MAESSSECASAAQSTRGWLQPAVAVAAIAWGANQFAPLIVLYQHEGVSATATGVMYGVYAVGLVPALVVGGRWSDQVGRRIVVRTAVLVSLCASGVLMLGPTWHGVLFLGRLLAGVSSGLAFGTGAAWIREMSDTGHDRHAGARRATLAMTVGFGVGPLVAGLLAQWLPLPQVLSYLPHLVIGVAALVLLLAYSPPAAPVASHDASRQDVRGTAETALRRHLVVVAIPFAPWVFATAAIALGYLPALVAADAGAQQLTFAAVATAIPALVGVAVQPLIRRWRAHDPARLVLPSMLITMASLAAAAWAARLASITAVIVAAALLGVAYGTTQFTGLAQIQHICPPARLGSATSVFQAISYTGFAVPYLLSLAQSAFHWSASTGLWAVAIIALAATGWLVMINRADKGAGTRRNSLGEHRVGVEDEA